MKKAKIIFKYDTQPQFWIIEVIDKKNGTVIYKSREKLGIKGTMSTKEKIEYMRNTIGSVINSLGYYF